MIQDEDSDSDEAATAANDNGGFMASPIEPLEHSRESRIAGEAKRKRIAIRLTAANDNLQKGLHDTGIYLVSDVHLSPHARKGEADIVRKLLGNKFWEIIRSEEK